MVVVVGGVYLEPLHFSRVFILNQHKEPFHTVRFRDLLWESQKEFHPVPSHLSLVLPETQRMSLKLKPFYASGTINLFRPVFSFNPFGAITLFLMPFFPSIWCLPDLSGLHTLYWVFNNKKKKNNQIPHWSRFQMSWGDNLLISQTHYPTQSSHPNHHSSANPLAARHPHRQPSTIITYEKLIIVILDNPCVTLM